VRGGGCANEGDAGWGGGETDPLPEPLTILFSVDRHLLPRHGPLVQPVVADDAEGTETLGSVLVLVGVVVGSDLLELTLTDRLMDRQASQSHLMEAIAELVVHLG